MLPRQKVKNSSDSIASVGPRKCNDGIFAIIRAQPAETLPAFILAMQCKACCGKTNSVRMKIPALPHERDSPKETSPTAF